MSVRPGRAFRPKALAPSLCILSALLAEVGASAPEVNASHPANIPTFEINLDLPPRRRWVGVAQSYRSFFAHYGKKLLADLESSPDSPWSDQQRQEIYASFGHEIREEIEGFVEALQHPLAKLEHFMKQQAVYEFGMTQGFDCSGIVATKADGTTIHGRNLDLGGRFELAPKLTLNVEFVKGGVKLARGVTFLGNVGVPTGMRLGHHRWTIEQNTRFAGPEGQELWVQQTMKALRLGGRVFALAGREILLSHTTFEGAVAAFANTRWLAPMYFVMAGSRQYEGAVVTVDRSDKANVWYDIWTLSPAAGRWLLIQTNDDHWGDPMDTRRDSARVLLKLQKKRKHGVDGERMMYAMRSEPVCNELTVYSWVATPSTGSTRLQMGPCEHSAPSGHG